MLSPKMDLVFIYGNQFKMTLLSANKKVKYQATAKKLYLTFYLTNIFMDLPKGKNVI